MLTSSTLHPRAVSGNRVASLDTSQVHLRLTIDLLGDEGDPLVVKIPSLLHCNPYLFHDPVCDCVEPVPFQRVVICFLDVLEYSRIFDVVKITNFSAQAAQFLVTCIGFHASNDLDIESTAVL